MRICSFALANCQQILHLLLVHNHRTYVQIRDIYCLNVDLLPESQLRRDNMVAQRPYLKASRFDFYLQRCINDDILRQGVCPYIRGSWEYFMYFYKYMASSFMSVGDTTLFLSLPDLTSVTFSAFPSPFNFLLISALCARWAIVQARSMAILISLA